MNFKYKAELRNIIVLAFLIYLRYKWSTISQWREDSATNIWLAYTKNLSELPVGLLSSKMIPTPNGIILFGKIFTVFKSLLHLTFFLSILQIILFFFLSKEISNNKNLNNFTFFLLSASTLTSASSVEFWNQWILILVNTVFFIFLLKYLNTQKGEFIILLICIATIPPAIYLAGISNALVYVLLICIALSMNKNYKILKHKFIYLFSGLFYLILNYVFVWNPYFNSIKINEVFGFSGLTLYDRVNIFSDIFIELPGSFLTIWTKKNAFYINQIEISGITNVNSDLVHELFKLFVEFHKVITVLFCIFIFLGIRFLINNTEYKRDTLLLRKIFLFFVFIITSILINPILGGPNFINLERMENMNQYYQFFLLIWLLTPFVFTNIKVFKNKIIPLNYSVFSIFISINIALSLSVFSSSLNYDGNKLTEADVPLIHKIELIEFIGNEVQLNRGESSTSVSYYLGGGRWNWIPSHGQYFSTWYEDHPFTMGRVYDYQLYREFLITNKYEGLNSREFENSDFIVTYKFEDHDVLRNIDYEHHYFGRLRLSKLKDK